MTESRLTLDCANIERSYHDWRCGFFLKLSDVDR
jgi:hypothetical protein